MGILGIVDMCSMIHFRSLSKLTLCQDTPRPPSEGNQSPQLWAGMILECLVHVIFAFTEVQIAFQCAALHASWSLSRFYVDNVVMRR
jgi:hypothetical protein